MELSFTFKLDADEREDKLKRARACAEELGSIECSWHNQRPRVEVAMDEASELKWVISDVCCEDFGRILSQAIEEVTPKL